MQAFNLLDEPWITVCFPDGSRGGVGIREALLEAKKIRAIENTSPLVVVAIHRLLLAVLYRALSEEMPLSGEREDQILASGFPGNSLNGYFGKWSRRFYLFDDEFPFWQMPRLAGLFKDKDYFSWTVLAAEHNTKNTKVLFDHFDVNSGEPIPYAAAARWLAAAQT
ncbi:MAG: type I-E CRISPR-associated protein Cse1/CasA, partial [Planctomycetota bacterium]|nr:type I-E CRISPR-associated protein Cse1/CasA [Planctomycetota bacterium]